MGHKKLCPNDGKKKKSPRRLKQAPSDTPPLSGSSHKGQQISKFTQEGMEKCLKEIEYYQQCQREKGLPQMEVESAMLQDVDGITVLVRCYRVDSL